MVHRNGSDHRDVAVRGVGRVPGSAHPHLEDEHVDGRVGARDEGEHREQLEERQWILSVGRELLVDEGDERFDLIPGVGHRVICDRLTVDQDPLREPHEVRAREEAGPQAVRANQRLDHARRRGLAVGAGHVYDAICALRVVEVGEHLRRAVEARLDPRLPRPRDQLLIDCVGPLHVGSAHRPISCRATAMESAPAFA